MLGKAYWRSLDELAETPEFAGMVEKEFPGLAEELAAPASRRDFLKVMGASLTMAGLAACRWPKELILPFANRPEGRIPGVADRFATAMELGGSALGLVVTSYDGRPVKVEGNPLHPSSQGAANAFAQASVLELYDPDRSRHAVRRESGQQIDSTWEDFVAAVGPHLASLRATGGAGLAVLAEATSSPSVRRLRDELRRTLPAARWFEYEPVSRDSEREGTRLAFGTPMRPVPRLERAAVIVALDEDIVAGHPDALRLAREFAAGRRADDGTMNRLWVVEPLLSLTGAAADHRLAVGADRLPALALALAGELAGAGLGLPAGVAAAAKGAASSLRPDEQAFLEAMARDVVAAGKRAVILAGPAQPPAVHAVVHALNAALGAAGSAIDYVSDGDPDRQPHAAELGVLTGEIEAGRVSTVFILGGNPAFTAPADVDFAGALGKCGVSVHLSLYDDETSVLCRWHLPRAHYLEAWGDARAWDGTVSVVQPLIEPLYGGRTPAEVLSVVLGNASATAHDITRETMRTLVPAGQIEAAWQRALANGLVAESAWPAAGVAVRGDGLAQAVAAIEPPPAGDRIAVVFRADASVHDGRFANNAWLQELPDPLTRLTWDNAALIGPGTARSLGVAQGDMVRVACGGRALELPAYVLPGVAEGAIGVPLGYGRVRGGRVAHGAGFNAYPLRASDGMWLVTGAAVTRTGASYDLACTQEHHVMDEIGIAERAKRVGEVVREASLGEFRAHPRFAKHPDDGPAMLPLWQAIEYTGEHQWGMAIDLSACVGCNACAIACQAENNIPVVGKRQVINGREMHWIRVDRYFSGKPETPKVAFQPLACQQCENAPCESVCPVAATTHSEEGLNQMVYNRCVGTRYCSNNCPYKVRRFNFFNYFKQVPQVEKMVFNPEVTVRSRGVMEKCTFCIQRIEAVKIAAKNDRRPIRDGEIVPACAQTCPTEAIVFGDLKDPGSRVSRLHRHVRSYGLLEELFTKPRNRYLAKLRNPSPDVKES